MADSPLLKKQNNNTATAALRRFRQPVNEGWPAYEAILRKNNIENTALFILSQSWFS
jgi:hypothetical protein